MPGGAVCAIAGSIAQYTVYHLPEYLPDRNCQSLVTSVGRTFRYDAKMLPVGYEVRYGVGAAAGPNAAAVGRVQTSSSESTLADSGLRSPDSSLKVFPNPYVFAGHTRQNCKLRLQAAWVLRFLVPFNSVIWQAKVKQRTLQASVRLSL